MQTITFYSPSDIGKEIFDWIMKIKETETRKLSAYDKTPPSFSFTITFKSEVGYLRFFGDRGREYFQIPVNVAHKVRFGAEKTFYILLPANNIYKNKNRKEIDIDKKLEAKNKIFETIKDSFISKLSKDEIFYFYEARHTDWMEFKLGGLPSFSISEIYNQNSYQSNLLNSVIVKQKYIHFPSNWYRYNTDVYAHYTVSNGAVKRFEKLWLPLAAVLAGRSNSEEANKLVSKIVGEKVDFSDSKLLKYMVKNI